MHFHASDPAGPGRPRPGSAPLGAARQWSCTHVFRPLGAAGRVACQSAQLGWAWLGVAAKGRGPRAQPAQPAQRRGVRSSALLRTFAARKRIRGVARRGAAWRGAARCGLSGRGSDRLSGRLRAHGCPCRPMGAHGPRLLLCRTPAWKAVLGGQTRVPARRARPALARSRPSPRARPAQLLIPRPAGSCKTGA